jgi:hypothetical protein
MCLYLISIDAVLIIQTLHFHSNPQRCWLTRWSLDWLRDCQVTYLTVCVWVGYGKEMARAVNCQDSYLTSSCYKLWEQLRSLHVTWRAAPTLNSASSHLIVQWMHWALTPSCSLFVLPVIWSVALNKTTWPTFHLVTDKTVIQKRNNVTKRQITKKTEQRYGHFGTNRRGHLQTCYRLR